MCSRTKGIMASTDYKAVGIRRRITRSRFHSRRRSAAALTDFCIVAPQVEPCADFIASAAARRSFLLGGGGAPPTKKNRRRRRRRGAAWSVPVTNPEFHKGV